ncbi:hypothetical protein NOK12_10160 [Nocardioides sp. OK12]|uniref:hypothetical protein n=1 Tax=Nocardioides sp. OK12 TaxID=2758661 RepID=UPI0021C273A8|nr:hypothetical protein [Nocardioides sp. OK12]GHJ58497.1 hypothetical protein NOK12_10160 [Nocardioides sp. OK12]
MHDSPGSPRLRPSYDDRYLDEPAFGEPAFGEPAFGVPGFREPWLDGPAWDDRLTELVFLDGRLVCHRTGPVAGTEWARLAADRDRERQLPPPPPPTPLWQDVLDWLGDRVGGERALAALHDEPLGEAPDLPDECGSRAERQRVEAVAELLDSVAGRFFDAEVATALRTALLTLWRLEPEAVARAATAASCAGGISWAVAKANGLLAPTGGVRVGALKDHLDLRSSPSAYAAPVRAGLLGFRHLASRHHRPLGVPDLLDLGHADLLTGATRARLLHLRDRARAARDADHQR